MLFSVAHDYLLKKLRCPGTLIMAKTTDFTWKHNKDISLDLREIKQEGNTKGSHTNPPEPNTQVLLSMYFCTSVNMK